MASTSDQTTTELRTETQFQDDASSINSALAEIFPENIENTFITKAPEERFRLRRLCSALAVLASLFCFGSPVLFTLLQGLILA